MINSGIIDANDGHAALTIATGANAITNAKLLEATGSGELLINTSLTAPYTGSQFGYTIEQSDTGVLKNGGTAEASGGSAFLGIGNLANSGVVEAIQGGYVVISGAVTNTKTIEALQSGFATSRAEVDILGTLANSGTLVASGHGGAAFVTVNGSTVSNAATGFIEALATSSGGVTLTSLGAGTVTNSGVIAAVNSGMFTAATVEISAATIVNAKTMSAEWINAPLTAIISGIFTIFPGGAHVSLSGGTVTNSGTMVASATGTNFSEADVTVNANTFTNSGSFTAIAAAGGIVEPSISAGTVVNRGTIVDSATGAASEADLVVSGGTSALRHDRRRSGAHRHGRRLHLGQASSIREPVAVFVNGAGQATMIISGNTISNAGTLEASGPRSDLVVSAGSFTNAKTVEVLDDAGNFTEAELSVSGTTIANSATMLASATNAFSLATLSISAATVSNSNTIEALGNNAVDYRKLRQRRSHQRKRSGWCRRHHQRQHHRQFQFRHHPGVGHGPEQHRARQRERDHRHQFRHDGGADGRQRDTVADHQRCNNQQRKHHRSAGQRRGARRRRDGSQRHRHQ